MSVGQIELYTHSDIMPKIVSAFQAADYKPCALYLMESLFLNDISKFFAGVLTATSAMLQLGIPHLNVLSKMDLIKLDNCGDNNHDSDDDESSILSRYLYPDPTLLEERLIDSTRPKFIELNKVLVQLLDEFDMVNFIPLNIKKEASLENVMMHIEMLTQFSESLEPKESRECDEDGGEE